MILIYAFSLVVLYNLIINFIRLKKANNYLRKYEKWLKGERTWDLVQSKADVIELFKRAGVSDCIVPVVKPAGYGQLMTSQASVFANFPSNREDIASNIMTMLHEAIGIYRRRITNSINPLFWVETVIYLPTYLLSYLNFENKTVQKVFNLLYWITSIAISFTIFLYGEELKEAIKSLFNR